MNQLLTSGEQWTFYKLLELDMEIYEYAIHTLFNLTI